MKLRACIVFMICCCCILVFPFTAHGTDQNFELKIKSSAVYPDGSIPERSEDVYYRNLQDALSVAESGDTLVLSEDLTQTESLNDGWGVQFDLQEITIDLNGHFYKDTGNSGSIFRISEDAGLIIKNTGSQDTGVIQTSTCKRSVTVDENGKLTLLSGTIKNTRSLSSGIENAGTVAVYGGTITGSGYPIVCKGNKNDPNAVTKIYDGTVTSTKKSPFFVKSGILCIYGGRIKCAASQSCFNVADETLCSISVNGGVYNADVSSRCESGEYVCCMNDHEDTAANYPWKVVSTQRVRVDAFCGIIDDSGHLNLSEDFGTVLGSGVYAAGDQIVLTAPMKSGWSFSQWYRKDGDDWTALSQSVPYSCRLSPDENILIAAGYTKTENKTVTLCVEDEHYQISGTNGQDGTYSESQSFNCDFGAVITLTADDRETFRYWMNESDKIVNEDGAYTFEAVRNGTIKSHRLNAGQTAAQVDYFSAFDQLFQSSIESGTAAPILPIIQPAGMGRIFNRWIFSDTLQTADVQTILQRIQSTQENEIRVLAEDESADETCDIVLIYPNAKDSESFCDSPVGEALTIQADINACLAGEKFAYWTDGENHILCFSDAYELRALSDMMLSATYLPQDEATSEIPVLVWQEETIEEQDQRAVFKLTAGRSVPDDFEVMDHGILYATEEDQSLTVFDSGSKFAVSSDLSRNGSFTGQFYCGKTAETAGVACFCRAYLILRREDDYYILYTEIEHAEG